MHTWAYRGNLGALRIDHHSLVAEFTLETSRSRVRRTSRLKLLSKDPILFGGGDVNLYRYVQNEPVNYFDPTGKGPIAAVLCTSQLLARARSMRFDTLKGLYETTSLINREIKNLKSTCPPQSDQIAELEELKNQVNLESIQSLATAELLIQIGGRICAAALAAPTP